MADERERTTDEMLKDLENAENEAAEVTDKDLENASGGAYEDGSTDLNVNCNC